MSTPPSLPPPAPDAEEVVVVEDASDTEMVEGEAPRTPAAAEASGSGQVSRTAPGSDKKAAGEAAVEEDDEEEDDSDDSDDSGDEDSEDGEDDEEEESDEDGEDGEEDGDQEEDSDDEEDEEDDEDDEDEDEDEDSDDEEDGMEVELASHASEQGWNVAA